MTNPYTQQAGGSQGSTEKLPIRKFTKVGDTHQGVIIGQTGWLKSNYEEDKTYRIISLQNGDDRFSIVVSSKGQKQAVGDELSLKGYSDTDIGDQFAMQYTEDVPTNKGNPFKRFKAVVSR